MAVYVQGDSHCTMSQCLGDYFGMNARRQHQGCVAMTHVVEADAQPCTFYYSTKIIGQSARVYRLSIVISEDELSDNDFDLASLLVDSFARAIAEAEETAFVAGTGHDNSQPEGFTVDTTLAAATITTTAAGAVTIEKFLEMIYTCPSKFRKGASFLVHSLTELELRKLRWKDAAGTYEGGFLWQPSVIEGRPNTFLGYPIHTQDDMATLAGTEGVIAPFGNFMVGYRILDHTSNMSVQRLVELYAEAGLIGFKVHKRVGGYCIRPANKSIVLLTEHA